MEWPRHELGPAAVGGEQLTACTTRPYLCLNNTKSFKLLIIIFIIITFSTRAVHKVKNVSPFQDILYIYRNCIQCTSFGTYRCILFHIVAFDIKALVVAYLDTSLSGLHHLRSACQQGAPSFFGNRKRPTVPGPDCTEDVLRCPNRIAHAARLLSAGQYADVHCRVTKQFHARACLFGKITSDLIGLQKRNNTSHLTVGGILRRHSHLCTYHVTRSDEQLHKALSNIILNTRNQWSAATKQVRGLYAQTFFTFWIAIVSW